MTDTKPSKSERKRQFLALQELGERLIQLSDDQLRRVDADSELLEQIRLAKTIKSHGALRRQKQLIGKLMRNVDPEPIRTAISRLTQSDAQQKSLFKTAETWRDRIVERGDDALHDFVADGHNVNNAVRQIVASLQQADDPVRRKSLKRRLFRELHALLESDVQNGTN